MAVAMPIYPKFGNPCAFSVLNPREFRRIPPAGGGGLATHLHSPMAPPPPARTPPEPSSPPPPTSPTSRAAPFPPPANAISSQTVALPLADPRNESGEPSATFHAKTAVTGLPLSHPPEAELSGAIHHSPVLRLHSPENFIHLLA